MDKNLQDIVKKFNDLNAQMEALVKDLYANRHEAVKTLNAANTAIKEGKEPDEGVMALFTLTMIAEQTGLDIRNK